MGLSKFGGMRSAHLASGVLGDANALAVVPTIAVVAANHKRAILDTAACTALDAVRRLIVNVI